MEQRSEHGNAEKLEIMSRLRTSGELFVLASLCTGAPYVVCDEETYDDEILIYFDGSRAVEKSKEMTAAGFPVRTLKIENKDFLLFYTSLYTMGINAMLVRDGQKECVIQLTEFVKRNNQVQEGKVWVENPSLHLTMLYYMQEARRKPGQESTAQAKEWQEEITNGFLKGTFIIPAQAESNSLAAVKVNDHLFQAIFTDILEFQKFNRGGNLRPLVITADKITQIMTDEAEGVIINPMEVRMTLQVKKKSPDPKSGEDRSKEASGSQSHRPVVAEAELDRIVAQAMGKGK